MNIRNWLRGVTIAASVGLALLSSNVTAVVLTSNLPPSANLGTGLTSDALDGTPLSQLLTFSFAGPMKINKISIWGFYLDENGDPMPASPVSPFIDSFVITLNGTAVVPTTNLDIFVETNPGGALLTRYEFSFADMEYLVAPASLEVINNFNDGLVDPFADGRYFLPRFVARPSAAGESWRYR